MPSDGSKAQIIVADKIAAAKVPLLIYIWLMSTVGVGAHNMDNVECLLQIPTHVNLKDFIWIVAECDLRELSVPFNLILLAIGTILADFL